MRINRFVIGTVVLLIMAAAALWLVAKSPAPTTSEPTSHQLKIVTTLFPTYDMTRALAGDQAEVTLLLPPGVEAHDFEPTPSDLLKINQADIFVYTGQEMEPWVEDILTSVKNKSLLVVDASQGIKKIAAVFHDADEPAGSNDPHIWLDFTNAKLMAAHIAKALQQVDPTNRDLYQIRLVSYQDKLTTLDNQYRQTLATCKTKTIVYGGHYAFGYLARRYGLNYLAAQGVSPDAEPTAADLAALVTQIKKEKVKYLFYEELSSPKIAETLAAETQTKLLLLNAAHNVSHDQLVQGTTFFEILSEDLANLRLGLDCQNIK